MSMFAHTFSRRSAAAGPGGRGGGGAAAALAMGAGALGWMTERQVTERVAVSTQRWASSRLLQTLRQRQIQAHYRPQHVNSKCFKAPFVASRPLTTETTAAASPKKPPGGAGGGFVKWYEGHLQSHPVPTKMVTGCILWSTGDAVAQVGPHWEAGTEVPKYDWERTGRAALFGFALHAPLSHLHFNFLEWMTVKAGLTGLSIPFFKTTMEQFVYWSWVSNSLYHGAMGFMQGMNVQQVYDRIADVLWDTQVAQWTFWFPIQLLNFQFVPVRHQLNFVLLTSIVWTALLSAWYPPEEQQKKDEKKNATSHA